MESKKNLQVNCAACDVRNVTEDLLNAYEEVQINAAALITSPEAQALLGRCGVQLNAAANVNLEGDVRFTTINSPLTIGKGRAVPVEKTALLVNGPLTIEPGCEDLLKSYACMVVNGPVFCPESAVGLLSGFCINGPVRPYPDGAILLKKTAELDRFFHLRAKQDALYYAAGKIIALAGDINFQKLAEKNVRFATKQLVVSESLAEAAIPLFDEKADILVLPDGCAYVDGSATLDRALVKRYGGGLYINGDLTLTPDSAAVLDQVTCLRVDGDLLVPKSLRDKALETGAAYDRLKVVGSVLIRERGSVTVSRELLEQAEDGVSIMECGTVVFLPDVSPELIREKLTSISECGAVTCIQEQLAVIEPVASEVGCMGPEAAEDEEEEEDSSTVQINTAFHAF